MKANVMVKFVTLDGVDMSRMVDGKERDVLLRDVCENALLEDDRGSDGGEKMKRFKLAEKIHLYEDVNLSAEDVTLLKELIGKLYGPLVVGQAYKILDPEEEKDESTGEGDSS